MRTYSSWTNTATRVPIVIARAYGTIGGFLRPWLRRGIPKIIRNAFASVVRSTPFHAIIAIIYEKRKQLLSSLFIIFILMLASSICMYSAEHAAQPDVFKNAFSGFWWSVTTILTIGYGDIYPVTTAGTIIAIIMSFLGVGAVAIPTGIISAGFVEQYEKEKNALKRFQDVKEIGEIVVGKRSDLKGKTIEEIQSEYEMNVYLVIRDELSAIPDRGLKVHQGDILIVRSGKVVKSK